MLPYRGVTLREVVKTHAFRTPDEQEAQGCTVPADPSGAAQELAKELRERRKAAGFASQDALAKVLNCDRTRVTKAETGQSVPTDDLLDAWGEACNFDARPWKVVARYARERFTGAPRRFEGWLDAERKAHTLRIWQPLTLPGLFQTADFARALYSRWPDKERAEEQVEIRMRRKAIFERPDPPNTTVVLDQSVLYRLIGSPQIMQDQIAYLVEMSQRPTVMIHILPSDIDANAGVGGAIHLATGFGMPEVLLGAAAVEDQVTQEPALVRAASDVFNLVRSDALPRMSSRTFMVEALEKWQSRRACTGEVRP
jgi:transcriptional regulator with XRE-family HTH domain